MTSPEPAAATDSSMEVSPFLLEFFMVQGAGFRCAAYCDEDGHWHEAHTREELHGPIQVLK
jgi:hypothetical protein